ncbi:dihydrofolate synthase/folylpolyglutamate synthase [Nocardioides albertanoniae]|uniref:Dihydrofolate synthase/folylpolyglutamate synthase n=1 Tax=Nocardioides albertanoniae TaxID=1175486 RepID=A0A543AAV5_9ACTN|nr:folylpolyglutamate synthase/dihydrofolate synthase family protein [Nocardioides albertanoniae]TQL69586.1 dihydrofolate synthase/folylpolyglutamate synthase [Nocardioides albertanoniae]
MSETPSPRLAATIEEVWEALQSRWPETRLEPSLDRIRALLEILGDPQSAFRIIQLTGTNGKTSTSRMIDTLLRSLDLRTGRFTSPHVERINERIAVDGESLTDEEFVAAFNDVAHYLGMVDDDQPHPLSFFETMVGMAYAKFAEAPVDVAVVEVGLGGGWDATNVADADVAVLTPIAVDHAKYLGETPVAIAREKSGIIKPGAVAVVSEQSVDVAAVIDQHAAEVGARLLWEGTDFAVVSRTPAVGGQILTLRGLRATYEDVFLPLYGAHQAQNAATALAAVEAFLGETVLADEVVRDAFAKADSPARLEIVRASPTVLLDAAHNPAGAEATVEALEDSFSFSGVVGVIGVMADKDADGLLAVFEPHLEHLVVTQNSTERALPAVELGKAAVELYGEDRVSVVPRLADAIDAAIGLSESSGGGSISEGAVLVTGSVVTAGEARTLLGGRGEAAGAAPTARVVPTTDPELAAYLDTDDLDTSDLGTDDLGADDTEGRTDGQ